MACSSCFKYGSLLNTHVADISPNNRSLYLERKREGGGHMYKDRGMLV